INDLKSHHFHNRRSLTSGKGYVRIAACKAGLTCHKTYFDSVLSSGQRKVVFRFPQVIDLQLRKLNPSRILNYPHKTL
ncbi:MAG: hypothetical protein LBL24_11350, partial [Bacteroidales bacterium]|nr:hypothetical protein [Bacteroidales bacterium]